MRTSMEWDRKSKDQRLSNLQWLQLTADRSDFFLDSAVSVQTKESTSLSLQKRLETRSNCTDQERMSFKMNAQFLTTSQSVRPGAISLAASTSPSQLEEPRLREVTPKVA